MVMSSRPLLIRTNPKASLSDTITSSPTLKSKVPLVVGGGDKSAIGEPANDRAIHEAHP